MKKTIVAFLLVIILSLSVTAAVGEIPLSASMYNFSTGYTVTQYGSNYYIQFRMGAAGGFPPYQYSVELLINGTITYSNVFSAGGLERINRFSLPDGTYRINLTVTDSHAQTALAHTTAVVSGGAVQYIAEDTPPVYYTGWSEESGYWYYYVSSVRQTGWNKIGGHWFYLGTSGAMVTGVQTIGGKQYTFGADGILQKRVITLTPSAYTLSAGDAKLLNASITPWEAGTFPLTWTSSNPAAASVNSSGLVLGNSPGTAIISATATDGTTTVATSQITVIRKVQNITLSPSPLTLDLGTFQQITATVSPADATNQTLVWSSSNTSIATVSSTGIVTAKGQGVATITAFATDGSGVSASLTVTVTVPDGWHPVSEGWAYYLGNTRVTGWFEDGGFWYHMNSNGIMQTGMIYAGSDYYYLDGAGHMQTGWQKVSGNWYYFAANGARQKGWLNDGSSWYYLRNNGIMATGWVADGGAWYYLNSFGIMQTGWIKDAGTWYYMNTSGAMKTGWLQQGGSWYYLAQNGAMTTGWVQQGGSHYYINASGVMQTGWVNVGGSWYYLNASGARKTGWLQQDSTWYYLKGDGVMATGTLTIDGQVSVFTSNGYWLGYQ